MDRELKSCGFCGNYPHYRKERTWITAAEEHTFTVPELDWEDFQFRIRFMISRVPVSREKETDKMLNAGFFRRKGRTAEIAEELSQVRICSCVKD